LRAGTETGAGTAELELLEADDAEAQGARLLDALT